MTGGAFGSMFAQLFHLTRRSARPCSSPAPPRAWRRPSPRRSRPCCSPSSCCCSSGSRAASSRSSSRRRGRGVSLARCWAAAPLFPVPAALAAIRRRRSLGCVGRRARGGLRRPASLTTARLRASRTSSRRLPHPLDVVARARRPGRRPRRSPRAARARRRLRRHRGAAQRPASSAARCVALMMVKALDLGHLARLGHLRRRARAAAHDGRVRSARSRRWSCPARARLLAADQHGRDPRRHDALAAHRHRVRARADARLANALLPLLSPSPSRTRSPSSP